MRAIIINAEERTVSETEIDGKLDSLQQIVGGLIHRVYPGLEGTDHHCYVNNEGLLNNPQHFFMLRDGHQPLPGNGVILSTTGDGDQAPSTLPLDWVKERVTFMDLQAVREWAARQADQQVLAMLVGEGENVEKPLPPDPEKMNDARAELAGAAQTPANIDKWIQAASADLNISTADRLKASNLFREFQRLDWWSDYSDDGDVRYREMIRTGTALDELKEFAGAGKEQAYLASRIYDKTAPEEFMRPRAADGINPNAWYVPAIEHSRWTGEPLGEAAGVGQSAGKGQSH